MTALVGNRADALAILEIHRDRLPHPADGEFVQIGQGAFRTAYLHEKTGVVYKVDGLGRQWGYSNSGERRTAARLAKMQWEHVRVPKVSLFTFKESGRDGWYLNGVLMTSRADAFIIAMEYIAGDLGRDWESKDRRNNSYDHPGYAEFREKLGWRSCSDMHGANFLISADNKFVPIDMGS